MVVRPNGGRDSALRGFARRLLPNSRAVKIALLTVGIGLLVTLAVMVTEAIVAARGRRQLDARVAQLEQQILRDRHRRMQLEHDIARERQAAAERRARRETELAGQLAELKGDEQRLREQLAEARAGASVDSARLAEVQGKLQETRRRISSLDTERSLAERTIRTYQGAVGFIAGTWGWRDTEGRPLRLGALDEKGDPATDPSGTPVVGSEGTGPVLTFQFVGTGFLVAREGLILTNRHIAEPWEDERSVATLSGRGFTPRLESLEIFFPGLEEPQLLTIVAVSRVYDVALVRADLKDRKLPVVELERDPTAAVPGQPVVILGYPTGLDALLARIDEPLADALVAKARGDWAKIARELSARGMIRPLATQGHLADVLPTQLVYDAGTTLGGSGGPVFSQRGRVIGLTAAVLSDFPAATFGVPIRFGLELLPKKAKPAR